jgi:MarR family multiple antibiotic resistance transcriptional regulator
MPWHVLGRLYAVASKLTSGQLSAFFDDLVRCETRLYNAIGDRLRSEHGIVTSQLEHLRYFRDHPGARVAETAANFAAGIGAISKGIDRLEAKGWVSRHPNPADGRSSLVSLTSSGTLLVADAEETYSQALEELVTPTLTGADIVAAGAVLAALRRSLEAGRIGLPVG